MNTLLRHIEEQIDSVIDEKLTDYFETTIRDYVDVEAIVEDVIAEEL